ncbi:MAG: helix-turn-helix domain-containing protein [Cellulomonadaceae bacterium]|nr:helix-turn-helix domain-containing protein [Cellulomonadaceae bacterium]
MIGAATEARRRTRTPLTPEEVTTIRTRRAAGINVNALARQYGVTRQTI